MANKGKQRVGSKKKLNPMYRAPGVPRRVNVTFDGTVVNGIDFTASASTDAANNGNQRFRLDCSNIDSVSTGVSGITKFYNEYKYLSASLIYEPSTGPSSPEAAARIHIAYLDNVEKYLNWIGATSANKLVILRGIRNAKTYNAWERFTYNVPVTSRRKLFDVDNNTGETVDELDRSSQGFIIICIESVLPSASAHGVWRKVCAIRLTGLDYNVVS